ncbi:response regulator transcription factor [Pseudobutyrivibrio sp.]|uniref:response regulator transcription factor n=1 Tax=Pseudobutyrivibrio sp. TaxID=2014367 RepID=UPI003867523B
MDAYIYSKKILIVDDEPALLNMVKNILVESGFKNIVLASTMTEAIATFQAEAPDMAVLDVMLPDGDGFTLFNQINAMSKIPIIFLTAKDAIDSRLTGLGLGADDYIVKPFLPQELLLRICAVLRRSYKNDSSVITLDACQIDFERAEVLKGAEIIPLTAKEHILLKTLADNSGRIVTVDSICEALWGDNPFGYENSLNTHIRRIREKIESNPSAPVSLLTVKGLGYRLITKE